MGKAETNEEAYQRGHSDGYHIGKAEGRRMERRALKKWKELNLHEYSDDSGGFFYLLESELDTWLASRSKPKRKGRAT